MLAASLPVASAGTVTYSWISGKVHLLCPSLSMRRQALCTPVSSGSVKFSLPSSSILSLSEAMSLCHPPWNLPYDSLFLGSSPFVLITV